MNDEQVKVAMDVVSAGVVVGSIAQFLPQIAALASIIWFAIRIWESDTIQKIAARVYAWWNKR